MSYSLVHQTEQLLVRNTSVGMVCAVEEANAVCILKDNTGKISPPFFLPPSSTIEDLLNHVQLLVSYNPDSFEVLIVDDFSKTVVPNGQETKDRSAKEIGVRFQPDVTNCFEVCPKFQDPPSIVISPVPHVEEKSDDSSSNVPPNLTSGRVIDKSSAQYNPSWDVEAAVSELVEERGRIEQDNSLEEKMEERCLRDRRRRSAISEIKNDSSFASAYWNSHDTDYVGLVNQAMTCYLNSLLQALYMTPEFRNALYKWEFVGSREEMHKSIPYQLQRLFLNLQTSKRSAVETTKLTRSFGWDSSEAWQQHDIQELCRVMFDALEQKFHNTDQADFINNLYEGKMIDYVKCLECKTEKFREDTFLDIPLPVRPFGSTVAYNSIEEALQAFVQPETLDGNNQYFCEKCNKKCDAHKGLKFSRFPYVLTLHLKRFDFDYSTMHRIKLNDKVEFPQTLNLNSFISQAVCDVGPEVQEKNHNCSNKGDDVMTDDEGCQGTDSTDTPENTHSSTSGSNSSGSNADMQEYDEGIDLSNGISNLQQQENEKNRRHMSAAGLPEPYIYELFSIMIHSGSASGGHYYAYIKDFNTRDWFCFNDQSVSRITNEDISKTYGGGANRVYYSGAHSSSTNAYMLMYRQIDVKRNVSAMSVDEFPPHLQELMMRMQEEEEEERIIRERDKERIKIKVYTRHPKDRRFLDTHLVVGSDTTLADATIIAHKLLFKDDVPLEQCRLVNYNSVTHTIECSFDDQDEEMIGDLLARLPGMNSLFLEVRDRNARFEAYSPGRVVITVHVVHMDSGAVDFPLELPTDMTTTVKMFKSKLADSLRLPMNMRIITEDCNPTLLEDDKTLKSAGFYSNNRIFVTSPPKIESDADFNRKLCKIVERFRNTIEVICTLPETDKESLAKLGITTVVMEANGMLNGDSEALEGANSTRSLPCGLSPLFPPATHLDGEEEALGAISCSDQSTSEDSSLTDSDRTIVGEEADYGLAELSSSSNSPQCSGAQNLSSPDEKDPVVRGKKMSLAVQDDWDDSDDKTGSSYFSMKPLDRQDQHRMALIAVDKRMTVGTFKGALAQHLGVAPECVKLFLECKNSEVEIISSKDQYISFRDQQHIIVRLERALREGELRGKVYQLILDDQHDGPVFLCDWILNKDMTVGQAKKQILDELKSKEVLDWTDIRCRLRSKKWKDPGKIYLDNMTFRMLKIESNWEMFLQELPDGETVEHPSSITVLVRRWFPSRLKLGDFLEVTITAGPEGGLEPELSKLTGIPEDSLGIARPSGGQFPYKLSKEQKEGTSEWHVGLPLDLKDGEVLFYRDMNEEQKPLSEQTECGNESSSRELKFVRDSGNISSREERRTYSTRKESKFSPRKERALKIYVDSPTPSPRAEE